MRVKRLSEKVLSDKRAQDSLFIWAVLERVGDALGMPYSTQNYNGFNRVHKGPHASYKGIASNSKGFTAQEFETIMGVSHMSIRMEEEYSYSIHEGKVTLMKHYGWPNQGPANEGIVTHLSVCTIFIVALDEFPSGGLHYDANRNEYREALKSWEIQDLIE